MSDAEIDVLLSMRYSSDRLHMHNGNFSFIQYSSWTNPHIIVETVYSIPTLEGLFEDTLLYPGSYYLLQIGENKNQISNLDTLIGFSTTDSTANAPSTESAILDTILQASDQSFIRLNGKEYVVLRFPVCYNTCQ